MKRKQGESISHEGNLMKVALFVIILQARVCAKSIEIERAKRAYHQTWPHAAPDCAGTVGLHGLTLHGASGMRRVCHSFSEWINDQDQKQFAKPFEFYDCTADRFGRDLSCCGRVGLTCPGDARAGEAA
jgi:hypothetical protein